MAQKKLAHWSPLVKTMPCVEYLTLTLLSGLTVENQSACGKVAGKSSGTFFAPSCIKDDPFLF